MVKRERNVLFNDALNTFYLRLYGVRHMVKDHLDRERGNHDLCYASLGALAGTRNSSMGRLYGIRRMVKDYSDNEHKASIHN